MKGVHRTPAGTKQARKLIASSPVKLYNGNTPDIEAHNKEVEMKRAQKKANRK